jgi:Tfp pilus assembly protein PilF
MRRVWSVIRILSLVAAIQLLSHGLTPSVSAAFKNVGSGERPPDFTLVDEDGKEWSSEEAYAGEVSVLVFWAAWSPRSREILADLQKLGREVEPKHFRVIAVNAEHVEITAADRKAAGKIVDETGVEALLLFDQGLVAYDSFGAMALPSSLVLDTKGRVVFDLAGYPTTMRSDLADAVKKALGIPTSVELRPPEEYKPKNNALMYYNFGRRLMEKGQEEKAEAQLLSAVERDPDFYKPRVLLGIYFKKTDRLEEAIEQFEKVKKLEPLNHEASYQVAAVSLRAGNFVQAEKLFTELHEEFPARSEFALGLALAHKYQGAEEEYRQLRDLAATLLPAEPRIYYELGRVADSEGDLETTAALFRRALAGLLER